MFTGKFHVENLKKVSSADTGSNSSVEKIEKLIENDSYIVDAPTDHTNSNINAERDRKKLLKKKCKKVHTKLLNNSFDYEELEQKGDNEKENVRNNQDKPIVENGETVKAKSKHVGDTALDESIIVNGTAELIEHKPKKNKKLKSNLVNSVENHTSDISNEQNNVTVKQIDVSLTQKSKKKTNSEPLLCTKPFRILDNTNTRFIQGLNQELAVSQTSSESANKPRIVKCIREIDRLVSSQGVSIWSNSNILSLERNLTELIRILKNSQTPGLDQLTFQLNNGVDIFLAFLKLAAADTYCNTGLSVKPFLTCLTCLTQVIL